MRIVISSHEHERLWLNGACDNSVTGDGDPMIFLNRPVAGPITVIALILIFLPAIKLGWDWWKRKQAA